MHLRPEHLAVFAVEVMGTVVREITAYSEVVVKSYK